ncbi:putative 3-deoxy-D-manno-octulosonic acid transferase, mitochondrial [Vitis vinifera]|uniref:Putative 3-deoxy-D-manno-octulosonic acid transferase, mitochondrial n=1 Tax=Vitis vinifera TaxID=29760 RepID=A0A438EKP5_VITVI|nr:putative 3-deoxy-D-manno-octulosonic acid transferase, mitochondrial [Vitis vinifera]
MKLWFLRNEIITNQLPTGVIYQCTPKVVWGVAEFAPLDIPAAMDAFLGYWKPNAVMLMECELWPNLILGAARNGIALALLNARMSAKSFSRWSRPVLLPLISLMLSKFSLIVPLSTMQGIRFQLLQAPPYVINFSGDLKYTVEEFDISKRGVQSIEELKVQLAHRRVWMVSSIHRGEEEVMLGVHKVLMRMHPDMVTIIVPRYPQHGLQELQKEGLSVALRSRDEKLVSGTSIYVVDTLGELRHFYTLTPIAVIGGSFLPGLTGHNISEAAAAGCAVLTVNFRSSCWAFFGYGTENATIESFVSSAASGVGSRFNVRVESIWLAAYAGNFKLGLVLCKLELPRVTVARSRKDHGQLKVKSK